MTETSGDWDGVQGNRSAKKYTHSELTLRCLWAVARPFFRYSPRIAFGWRSLLLRMFGAEVGRHVHVYPSVRVFAPWALRIGDYSAIGDEAILYNLGPIHIGCSVTVSQRAHLCAGTHDYSRADLPLLKPSIIVDDQVWICADAFVGPGVRVGHGAVVGACTVVIRDVPAWTVVVGNPAREIKKRVLTSTN